MEKDTKDQKWTDSPMEKEEETAITRRQILHMGWSVPIALGLNVILPKMANAGATVEPIPPKHADHIDTHGDHTDIKWRPEGSERIYPPLKQSLSQEIGKIRTEINALQAKLNSARDGQDLAKIGAKQSALKIKQALQSLSGKINTAAQQNGIKDSRNLSNAAGQGVKQSLSLEQLIGSNQRSAALQQLNQLNNSLGGMQNEINRM